MGFVVRKGLEVLDEPRVVRSMPLVCHIEVELGMRLLDPPKKDNLREVVRYLNTYVVESLPQIRGPIQVVLVAIEVLRIDNKKLLSHGLDGPRCRLREDLVVGIHKDLRVRILY